jgi:hypothetical protein
VFTTTIEAPFVPPAAASSLVSMSYAKWATEEMIRLTRENSHLQMVIRRKNRRVERQRAELAAFRAGLRTRRRTA